MRPQPAIVLICAITIATPAVLACGPNRNREVTTIEIEAPASKVWDIVGRYDDMGWTGRIVRTDATGGTVPDRAKRTLVFQSGAMVTDTLVAYDRAAHSITFRTDEEDVHEMPVEGYTSKITVTERNGRSTVEWRGAFSRSYLKSDPPPEQSDEAAIAAVAAFQKQALAALKDRIERGS